MIDLDGALFATRAQAAEALREAGQPITTETVRSWERCGLIVPVTRVDGQPVYRMRDVWRAERDTRKRARRPRGS